MPEVPADGLLVFGAATANVALLILVAVIQLHRVGALADALGELSTEAGIGAFVALWAVTVGCTRRALRDGSGSAWLRRAVVWGGIEGIVVLIVVVVVAAIRFVAAGAPLADVAGLLFVAIVGCIPAWLVGSAIGFAAAIVDLACVALASLVVPATAMTESPSIGTRP